MNLEHGSQGTAPAKEAPAVYVSGKFLYAYGTQANANQVGLLQINHGLIYPIERGTVRTDNLFFYKLFQQAPNFAFQGTSIYSKYENETQEQHSIAQYFFVLR